MSRPAQDVLEFDKLRELLRLRTTCAPGHRAVDALEFSGDRAALETAFSHIREAREWLRDERELGFGGLADPQSWLGQIEGPGARPLNCSTPRRCSKQPVGCAHSFARKPRSFRCSRRVPRRLAIFATRSPRFAAPCFPMAILATTPHPRSAAFAPALRKHANPSRER
jgi:hypothetical protein